MIDLEKTFLNRNFEPDEGKVTARIKCPADFAAFDGHFPGQPVLPAVIQLAAVRILASSAAGIELEPVATEKLKFSAMVLPEEEINISLVMKKIDACWEVRFRLSREGGKVSAGTILYREGGN
ncbi:MAG: hypothetical protein KKG47_06980 [Proteobacteria bacterium]|nr:hypothetical protein [Pseudomonadota bacterium]MBU1739149.1 hypothetical protein [Pseudomonadota bacterium]